MSQTRLWSLIEAVTNVIVGYVLAVLTQVVTFPWFGIRAEMETQLGIGLVFTAISLVRSYTLRRFFNSIFIGKVRYGLYSAFFHKPGDIGLPRR